MKWSPTFLILYFLLGIVYTTYGQQRQKVLLVSFDGFRADYLDRLDTDSNFTKLGTVGVKADYLESTFVTKTFPAHYSIVTGMYEEKHGILGNHMYDPKLRSYFDFKNSSTWNTTDWWKGEPIWQTVQKNNKIAATFYWPGSEVYSSDESRMPKFRKAYMPDSPNDPKFEERVNTVMDWFKNKNVDFATIYFHEPDSTGHKFGPDSPNVTEKILEVDSYVGLLLKMIKDNGLDDVVNLFVVSDHGMTNMTQDDITDMQPLFANTSYQNLIETTDWGTTCQIRFINGTADPDIDNVKNILKANDPQNRKYTVYRKEDLPDSWHYKNNVRVQPLVIVSNEGYNVRMNANYSLNDTGTHGYNNTLERMRTIFFAKGPAFKKNYRREYFNMVNIYPLICKILNIKPNENIDGKLNVVNDMLLSAIDPLPNPTATPSDGFPWWSFLVAFAVALGALAIILLPLACCIWHYCGSDKRSGYTA